MSLSLGRMQIDIPDSWEDRSMYTFIAPRAKAGVGPVAQDDGFRTNVVVTVGPRGKARGLDIATQAAITEVRSNFGEVAIEQAEGPAIDGQQSRRLTYRVIEPGGSLPILQVQYVTILDDSERFFTFTTAAIHAKSMIPEIERMIRSVRLVAQ